MKLASAFFLLATASANATCYVGGSVGLNVNTPTLNNGIAEFGVNTRTVNVAPEAGCDVMLGNFVVGALGRVNAVPYSSGSIATLDSFKQSASYSALAKLGVMVNDATMLYGVGGLTTAKFDFNSFGTSATGTTFGGGLDLKLAKTDWSMFAEVDFTTYGVKSVSGGTIKPSETTFRVGGRWHPSIW